MTGQDQPAAPRRGRFITFEGGEGAGKSTQMKRLAASLGERGIAVVETREPGGTPDAEAIRSFILSGRARPLGGGGEAVLFAAARADHVDRVIRPALARGAFVLSDRFTDSTRAYQGPAETGLARAAARRGTGDADRFEGETIAKHEARRRIFLEIAAREPGRCAVIDATRGVDDVAAEIWQVVSERLLKPTP